MKFWHNWKNQNWFPYTVAVCAGVILYMLLNNLSFFGGILYWIWTLVKPLFYGLILAYLMDPVARFYHRKLFRKIKNKKFSRNISVVFGIITTVLIFGLLIIAVVPTLIQSLTNMFGTFSDVLTRLDENSGEISSVILPGKLSKLFQGVSISTTIVQSLSTFVTNNLSDIADTSATIGNGFANFLIAFVLAVYYMMDKDRLKRMIKRFFVWTLKDRFDGFQIFYKRADVILIKYIKGSLIEAFIVGVCNALFMLIGRIPYVLLISITIGVTNLAPTFGPIVGALIGSIILLIVNPYYALAFIIFTIIIQTIDGYILKPKLFGESLGVSPLLILIMIILGGRVMGVVGILIAIPAAAIFQFVWDDYIVKKK